MVPAQYAADGRSAGGLRGAARVLDCHYAQYAKQLLTGWWDQSVSQDSQQSVLRTEHQVSPASLSSRLWLLRVAQAQQGGTGSMAKEGLYQLHCAPAASPG